MLSVFELLATLLVATAVFGWANHRYLRLPNSIGLLVIGLVASLIIIGVELMLPLVPVTQNLTDLVGRIDFENAVLNGMLAFLLFAGALHVDVSVLRSRAWSVGLMATLGVLLSTAIVGTGTWALAAALGLDLPLPWALVFGALISPTDPVAVMSTLKRVKLQPELEVDMSGESLFNDGVGVVVFIVLLALATGSGGGEPLGVAGVARLFAEEAIGGAGLGLAAGYLAYRAMRAIDNYPIEVLISLALVAGTYALAQRLHTSGPIAMVVAGLLIGNRGPVDALSDLTKRYLFGFWTLVDELLNSVLFLLIGLEVLVLRFAGASLALALAVIPLALLARWVAVAVPVGLLRPRQGFARGTVAVLTWGGLRGGISVALALSLPEAPQKDLILAATYTVVIFTIVVQGLSLGRVVRRFA